MSQILDKLQKLQEAIGKISREELINRIKVANITKEEALQYAHLERYIINAALQQSIEINVDKDLLTWNNYPIITES